MIIKDIIIERVRNSLNKIRLESKNIYLEHPEKEEHGDYSTNLALEIYARNKKIKNGNCKNPKQIALNIVKELLLDENLKTIVSSIEVAGPGFINFRIRDKILIQELLRIKQLGKKYGSSKEGIGKTLIVDYSSPNIAKRFSIGHLRSTIIGQSLYNTYKFIGWKVIGDNHLGDWGTQFGKMIVAIRKWSNKQVDQLSVDELENLYIKFHKEVDKDPKLEEEARQAFKALEEGKSQEIQLWRRLVKSSTKEFAKIYDLLKVKFDISIGESFYEKIMPFIVKDAIDKKVAKKSKGALIITFPDGLLPPAMLLKSDGATTYLTRDLAAIKFRKQKYNPDLYVYEVGAEQTLHFQQLFYAAELLGLGSRDVFKHIPHGLIRLKEGKMSTRKGRTIKLEKVLMESIKRAKKFNSDKQIAKMVGIGAVKYNDLKHAPTTGYVFDWDEVLSLEGNSGPYLQYTYARCISVLRKSGKKLEKYESEIVRNKLNTEEINLLRWLYRFSEFVIEGACRFSPNLLCTFLHELSQRYNTFYHKHSVLKADTLQTKKFRLLLTEAVSQVLKNGLSLLGIDTPERM